MTSIFLRIGHEQVQVIVSSRRGEARGCLGGGRARPGSVVTDVVASCRVNATRLDAGVCIELASRRLLRGVSIHCVPSLAVIGAMKCGTTNLMLYLALHPRLRTSENALGWPVESRFFSRALDEIAAADRWREYVSRYPARRANELTFDKSPNYVVNPVVPRILRRLAPSIKLVMTVRDPTRRAYSHFQHDCRNARIARRGDGVVRAVGAKRPLSYPCEARDFDDMVRAEVSRATRVFNASTPDFECRWSSNRGRGDSSVVARGFYACQLARWLDLFPREQLLVLVFEKFVASRADTLAAVSRVERFVGVEPFDYDSSLRVKLVERVYAALPSRLGAYEPMDSRTKLLLDHIYCGPNAKLADLFPDLDAPWLCATSKNSSASTNASTLRRGGR
ncbi:hypothetical protein CTAYLR_002322 [Chrysophaeum taylorii]|uniref:Sulfotransferase domain-containing protein n=1 Tax=Chrysophaeum taylorii TaxID=2483200 RepID=A0AAD7UNJ9_9STRA|nr:hypothetical protein CTAYLR_002322 [Chrysophaeum taylorii]